MTLIWRRDIFKRSHRFTSEQVKDFLKLTGDNNAIHVDTKAANAAGFAKPLVPGILCASLFPAIIARQFPGALYLTQTLQFRKTVLVDSKIFAEVDVTQVHSRHVRFNTICRNGAGEVVIEGIALAKL